MAVGLALLGTGCSSESDNPGPSAGGTPTGTSDEQNGTPDPCQLLTLAEISAQFGVEYTVSEELPPGGLPGQRTCSYTEGPDSGGMVTVAVWPSDPAEVDSFLDQAVLLSSPTEIGQYDGIGDRAFGEPHALWIQAGNVMVNIVIVLVEVENVDPILQLGVAAAGRL